MARKCLQCKKEFQYKDGFDCNEAPGNHKLEPRTYYHFGGAHLSNERERRTWAPQVLLNAPADKLDKESGRMTAQQPIMVQFQNGGQYTTDDCQIQFYLETRTSVGWGDAGAKRWNDIYLTKAQRVDIREAEVAARERKITEENELLAQTRARVKSTAAKTST